LAAIALALPLAAKAYAILVFPEIVKAGALVGGLTGEGAMFQGAGVKGFYRLSAVSYGLQLGAQKYGYALFFMNEAALSYLSKSGGWSVGTGPSFVIVDEGFARSMTTTTLTHDVYAMPFSQRGLMAGGGIEGARIRQIYPEA
jgi:lipid-binding SYLF domain-containing protein